MRTMQWVGGISLAGLVLFGGCSCGEEIPISLPDLIPPMGAGGSGGSAGTTASNDGQGGANLGGTSGSRANAGGSAGDEDATNGAGGDMPDESAGGARATGGSSNAGGGASAAGGSRVSGESAGRAAGGQSNGAAGRAVGTGGRATGTGGASGGVGGAKGGNTNNAGGNSVGGSSSPAQQAGGSQVVEPEPDPGPVCRVSVGEACELSVAFGSESGEIAGFTLATCPDGSDASTGRCMGYGNLSNAQWTVSSDGRSLEGVVGVRAPDVVARVQTTVLLVTATMTCHLVVGGADFVQVPIRITLPDGTSATDFVPGCSPVSNPQITLLGPIDFSVTGDSGCPAAATLAQQSGGLATLEQSVQSLIGAALTKRVCLSR